MFNSLHITVNAVHKSPNYSLKEVVMKSLSILVVLVVAMLSWNCSGTKPIQTASPGEIPEWFVNIPQDPNHLYATGSGTSQDLQLAMNKAITSGRAEIARQTEVRLLNMQKQFGEEIGMTESAELRTMYAEATKTVVSTVLHGSKVVQQKPVNDDNLWRTYVLVEYPIGAANQAFLQQIKQHEEAYTLFRASETFKELEAEVEKFEQYKKEQFDKLVESQPQ